MEFMEDESSLYGEVVDEVEEPIVGGRFGGRW